MSNITTRLASLTLEEDANASDAPELSALRLDDAPRPPPPPAALGLVDARTGARVVVVDRGHRSRVGAREAGFGARDDTREPLERFDPVVVPRAGGRAAAAILGRVRAADDRVRRRESAAADVP
jgi:hypothetical protein